MNKKEPIKSSNRTFTQCIINHPIEFFLVLCLSLIFNVFLITQNVGVDDIRQKVQSKTLKKEVLKTDINIKQTTPETPKKAIEKISKVKPVKKVNIRLLDLDFIGSVKLLADGSAYFKIGFTKKVDLSELKKHITLEVDKKFLSGTKTNKNILFSLKKPKTKDNSIIVSFKTKANIVKLHIKEGLQSIDKSVFQDTNFIKNMYLERDLYISSFDPSLSSSRSSSSIEVFFSGKVDIKTLKKYIKIKPSINFRVKNIVLDDLFYDRRTDGNTDMTGYKIIADFKQGGRYTVSILKNLMSKNYKVLKEDFTRKIVMPDKTGNVFLNKVGGIYMLENSSMCLPFEYVNVNKIEFELYKIYSNNVINYLNKGSYSYRYNYNSLGRVINKKTVEFVSKNNQKVKASLDLKTLFKDKVNGIYMVVAKFQSNKYQQQRYQLVMLSDIGISVKKYKSGFLVWLNDLKTTNAIANAKIKIIDVKNQVIAEGVSDKSGMYYIKNINFSKKNELLAVTAETSDDFSVIKLNDALLDTSSFDVMGKKSMGDVYDAFIYTERGIYRPGETVHIEALVRNKNNLNIPGEFPVKFTIKRADGILFNSEIAKVSQFGFAGIDLVIPKASRIGKYYISLSLVASNAIIGEESFLVEDFMPDKIKVIIKSKKIYYKKNDKLKFNVSAKYLFGNKVIGALVNASCTFIPRFFNSANFKDYIFYDSYQNYKNYTVRLGTQKIKSKRPASFVVKYPENKIENPLSMLMARFTASVTELGGRTVSKTINRFIKTKAFVLGIKRVSNTYAQIDNKEIFKFVIVDSKGNKKRPKKAKLFAKLYFIENNWVLQETKNGYTYKFQKEFTLIKTKEIQTSDESFEFSPRKSGEYKVLLTDSLSGVSTSLHFTCAYSNWDTSWTNTRPDRLEITSDKKKYQYGEKMKFIIKSPFKGKGLFTIEGNELFKSIIFDMKSNVQTLNTTMLKEYGMNFYCSVTIIRPIEYEKRWSAHRAFGIIPISVDNKMKRLQITADIADTLKPNENVTLKVNVKDFAGNGKSAQLTLALVDEGICQLTDFLTPDPLNYFYKQKALTAEYYDMYSMLIPIYKEKKGVYRNSEPGGGAGGRNRKLFLNPVNADRVKNAIVWKRSIMTDNMGNASVAIKIPDYIGTLRFMLVAATSNSFGKFQKFIQIEQALMVSASFPRFLAPTDTYSVPVLVFNKTGKDNTFAVSINGKQIKKLFIKNEGRKRCIFNLKAMDKPGVFHAKINAKSSSYSTNVNVEIPVRPASSFTSISGTGVCDINKGSFKIEFPKNLLYAQKTTLSISKMPVISLSNRLNSLLEYPYGCVEQTTSKAFPLLYLENLAMTTNSSFSIKYTVQNYVSSAINRLLGMQTPRGGFSMWIGDYNEYPWGSIYATNFLIEAKKKGYKIRKSSLDNALKYLNQILRSRDLQGDKYALKAYASYVLALAGKGNYSWTMRLWEERKKLKEYSRIHIALAAMLMNIDKSIKNINIPAYYDNRDKKITLNSYIREIAMLLSAYIDLNRKDDNIPKLVKILEKSLKANNYYSTQENAYVLMALGKYMQKESKQNTHYKAQVVLDGKVIANTNSEESMNIKGNWINKTLQIKMQGKGHLYYSFLAKGIPFNQKQQNINKIISVKRIYKDRNANIVNLKKIKHGQLLFVKISVTSPMEIENIVISDLLPAGLEIENMRINTYTNDKDYKNAKLNPEYVDSRDDRLLLFCSLQSGENIYYYTVRAITKGTFKLPAISAECMYDNDIKSINGADIIEIY